MLGIGSEIIAAVIWIFSFLLVYALLMLLKNKL
jgi:hypothetical protein